MANTYEMKNQWGGHFTTCARHEAEQLKHCLGDWKRTESSGGECEHCRREVSELAQPWMVLQALVDPKLSHTRFRDWCGQGTVYIYHRDLTSPSGVILAAGCSEEVFNRQRAKVPGRAGALSPLSPTEGLGGR